MPASGCRALLLTESGMTQDLRELKPQQRVTDWDIQISGGQRALLIIVPVWGGVLWGLQASGAAFEHFTLDVKDLLYRWKPRLSQVVPLTSHSPQT